jgi:Adenylate kinase
VDPIQHSFSQSLSPRAPHFTLSYITVQLPNPPLHVPAQSITRSSGPFTLLIKTAIMAPNLTEMVKSMLFNAIHFPGVHEHKKQQQQEVLPVESGINKEPIFSIEKVTVIFVLGGPGAGTVTFSFSFLPIRAHQWTSLRFLGKGTQCSLLVDKFNFCHLSAGDLLRAEQDRPNSQFGDLIRTCIREGTIVPMEVTIKLLENAMHAALQSKMGGGWGEGKGRFLIDGFPRKMDQALKFEEDVGLSSLLSMRFG